MLISLKLLLNESLANRHKLRDVGVMALNIETSPKVFEGLSILLTKHPNIDNLSLRFATLNNTAFESIIYAVSGLQNLEYFEWGITNLSYSGDI